MTHPGRTAAGDPYATDLHRWWHLSQPSPELRDALDAGWIAPPGRALDLGCGLGTEAAFLAGAGFEVVGVDLSDVALRRGRARHASVGFLQADVRCLPFVTAGFDVLLDRGCFHYLAAIDRPRYAAEARRLLRPGGRLLLRACLQTAGVWNDIDEPVLRQAFPGWRFVHVERREIPSDTRAMPALVALLSPPP
jgi:SAM-dependent methyltransferase